MYKMNFDKLLTTKIQWNLIDYVEHISGIYEIDCSHGIQHSFGTMHYTGIILDYYLARKTILIEGFSQDTAILFIKITAFVHDMMDDKYVIENKKQYIEQKTRDLIQGIDYFIGHDNVYQTMIDIIDNMSYSKRQKIRASGNDINLGKLQLALEIVRDADLLEGYKIDRCRQFSIHKKNAMLEQQLNEEVYNLMSERVLTYYDKEISTPIGKILAKPLHEILKIQLQLQLDT